MSFMVEKQESVCDGGVNAKNDNSSLDLLHDLGRLHIDVPEKRSWKKLLAYLGPGFLVSMAYIDPANLESDLQAGASYKYELLWVLFLGSLGGLMIQTLSANLGIVTGQHLAQHCRSEYPKHVNYVLWILAEITIIASDIPEVIGTAFAINLLFGLPVWIGVLITGFSTLLFLFVQHYGVRKLEILISALVLIIAGCFIVEMTFAKPNILKVLKGLVVPQLNGTGATGIAISLIGAIIMPHNLFLHSALVLSRKTKRTDKAIRDGRIFSFIEVSFALLIAFVINVSVISVSGTVCNYHPLSADDKKSCEDLSLNKASFLLKNALGGSSSTLFAIALLASGQSSTITGTYAGQYVMEGFLQLKFKLWVRNLITRLVAICPSLLVSLLAGSRGAGKLIILSSMILSFDLPFALLPLLKFTCSTMKMGPYANSIYVAVTAWILGLSIIILNVYFLFDVAAEWLIHAHFHLKFRILIGICIIFFILAYLTFIFYLAFRRHVNFTYSPIVHPSDSENVISVVAHNDESLQGGSSSNKRNSQSNEKLHGDNDVMNEDAVNGLRSL